MNKQDAKKAKEKKLKNLLEAVALKNKPVAYRFDWPGSVSMGARKFAGADDPYVETAKRLQETTNVHIVELYEGPPNQELLLLLKDIIEDLDMRARFKLAFGGNKSVTNEEPVTLDISDGLVRRIYNALTPEGFTY